MNPRPDPQALLRWSLRGNGMFSALCGLVFVGAAAPLAATLGVPDPRAWVALGVGLLGFAGLLALLAARPMIPVRAAWTVVALDLAWIAGTVPLVAADVLTPTGELAALGVADAVLVLALLQTLGIRRVHAHAAALEARPGR